MLDVIQLRRLAEDQLQLPAMLHDYQWEGVTFLYKSQSALLADEMGLGKTVQTAVALALLLNAENGIRRVLIIAPASLTLNWIAELSTWAPSLTVRRIEGDARDRGAYYLLPIPILVGSYEQIRRDGLDRIPSNTFDLVILDEAQRIKNRHSTTALACRLIDRKRAWALSATPLENTQDDVLSILNFLDPAIAQTYPKPRLSEHLKSIMLRRRKSEVRAELPPVILQDLKLDLSVPQRKKYDEIWAGRLTTIRTAISKQQIDTALLGLITRLKIVCNFVAPENVSSKLDALETICEAAGDSARILVFSQYVETLSWISNRIEFSHDLLTGNMSLTQRQDTIDRFKSENAPRLLLISLRAGGVGLNLGEATHVVLFDRWWNPAVEGQAIYRAHRFERDTPLHVIRFLVTESIEEHIAQILERKDQLFDEIIEDSESPTHRFTRSELMKILGLSNGDIAPASLKK